MSSRRTPTVSARMLTVLTAAAALVLGCWSPAIAGAAPGSSPDTPAGIADTGRWLTDAEGRVLITSGVNMVAKRPPYAPDALGFGDDDAGFLADNGFDSVRLGVIWKAIEPQPGIYDDAYLARIKGTVETLARHGISSLIDMHQDLANERFQGEGMPDWAVLDDKIPAVPKLGFTFNQFTMPALLTTYDNFLDNRPGPGGVGVQDRFAAAWAHTAGFFRGTPGVMGYDLFNEPWPGSSYPACLLGVCRSANERLTDLHHRVARAIRTQDPNTTLFYEPFSLSNTGLPPNPGTAGDPNEALSFHDYCTLAALGSGSAGSAGSPGTVCNPFDSAVFANAEAHSRATGSGLLLTEFGATDDESVLASIVDRAAQNRVGWQYWAYCGCDDPTTQDLAGQALVLDPAKPPTGDNVRWSKVRTLAVPHPRLIAGTPESYGFDRASSTLRVRYSTARADGRGSFGAGSMTTVAMPQIEYPTGYTVNVIGAEVVSAPNSPVLQVRSAAGAQRVTLVATPA
ncbi:cellulase family glycosylhydrolase [Speluncibacter jeojiensis]|uniref:Cellulase family glycosylhydrolase n=1 Tax=Speluncibacter jeojiensis TaxID=2710754 RepID=A0A9X4REK3_9ACTN|nr:cellulase family glycosylhydrolase [Corynebacteriales bacterium D3-21]